MGTRVYSKTLTIQYDDVKSFYNKRAKEFSSGILPKYTCTLLNDTDSHYAEKWHDFEVSTIKPYLNYGKILDIGCGIGRWADVLANECISYCGIDFSEAMIEAAKQRFSQENISFFQYSFQDIPQLTSIESPSLPLIKGFDTIIIAGVSMYVNDDDLKRTYRYLYEILNKNGVIYLEESVGVEKRLTLKQHFSESLKNNYSVIYRTKEEYLTLLKDLTDKMILVKESYLSELDKPTFRDTSHWFLLLKKPN